MFKRNVDEKIGYDENKITIIYPKVYDDNEESLIEKYLKPYAQKLTKVLENNNSVFSIEHEIITQELLLTKNSLLIAHPRENDSNISEDNMLYHYNRLVEAIKNNKNVIIMPYYIESKIIEKEVKNKNIISIFDKCVIIFNANCIIEFIHIPKDYNTDEFMSVIINKYNNNCIFVLGNCPPSIYRFLEDIDNSKISDYKKDKLEYAYKVGLEQIINFATNTNFDCYNKIEFKKLITELENLELKINVNKLQFEIKNINIGINRANCYLQYIKYMIDNGEINTEE
jgi:hypothetical protein